MLAGCVLPAPAQTFDFIGHSSRAACITIAGARYRTAAPGERADYTIRLDPAAVAPDIRVALSGSIDTADLVLIGDDAARCEDGSVRTVRIDPAAPAADLTVGFATATTPADYRIYLRETALAPETAAALFAAAQLPRHRPTDRIATSALITRKP